MIENQAAETLAGVWAKDERWKGIKRTYGPQDVLRLRGTLQIEYTLARVGAERFWKLLHTEDFVPALGALTGNQAMQQVKAGLKAIYLSGWQVAADANLAGADVPGPEPLPREQRAVPGSPHQQQPAARRPDLPRRGQRRHLLVSRRSLPTPNRASEVR